MKSIVSQIFVYSVESQNQFSSKVKLSIFVFGPPFVLYRQFPNTLCSLHNSAGNLHQIRNCTNSTLESSNSLTSAREKSTSKKYALNFELYRGCTGEEISGRPLKFNLPETRSLGFKV